MGNEQAKSTLSKISHENETGRSLNLSVHNLSALAENEILKHTNSKPEKVEQLLLAHNQLKDFSSLDKFKGLTVLDLSYNLIKIIQKLPESISKTLKTLILTGNSITEAEPQSLKNLEVLKLSLNDLENFPNNLDLPKLRDLFLSYNRIKHFDCNIPTLVTLYLDNNLISTISPSIFQFPLETLKISDNLLKEIPSGIQRLLTVTSLDFRNNRLVQIPEELYKLSKLKTLNLSCNLIEKLPSWETGFENLQELLLHQNKLKNIPDQFFQCLANVRILNLSRNQIETIPETIENLTSLAELDLSMNCLDAFPTGLINLTRLDRLELYKNNIKTVPNLLSMKSLRKLTLSYNPITEIPQIPNYVSEFHLAGSKINSLLIGQIRKLENTRYVSLAHNFDLVDVTQHLSNIPLQTLDVQYTNIPTEILQDLKKKSSLQLYGPEPPVEGTNIRNPPPVIYKHTIGFSEMKGKRPKMEDALVITNVTPEMDLVAIFDGHGGEEISKLAAEELNKILTQKLSNSSLDQVLNETFKELNKSCGDYKNSSKRVGTTALVILLQKNKYILANLGDSRAVLCNDGNAKRLSRDHKPLDYEERKYIKENGGFVLETGRVNGVLAVARALGDFYLEHPINSTPETKIEQIQPEDEFIILGCDGLWDVLSDQDAVSIVSYCLKTFGSDPNYAASILRDFAYMAGSGDNISVIVVLLNKN